MGVSYREEIRRRQKGSRAPNHSREQIRDPGARARDREEYFRKPHKNTKQAARSEGTETQRRMM